MLWCVWSVISVSLTILSHCDAFCDLLLKRRTAIWNLVVLYNKETNYYRKIFFTARHLMQLLYPELQKASH